MNLGSIEELKLQVDINIDILCIYLIVYMIMKDFNLYFLWLLMKMKIMKIKLEY